MTDPIQEDTALAMWRNTLGAAPEASLGRMAADAAVTIAELRYNLARRTAQLHQATHCPHLTLWWKLSDNSLGLDLMSEDPGEGERWQELPPRASAG